jgi:PhzF family phenazine biosynthesis protein
MTREALRYAAFTIAGQGGNPAGIVLDAGGMTDAEMLAVAAEIGYSETAFLVPRAGEDGAYDVRYFAPEQEVPFCGHATIASGVALAEGGAPADLTFHTPAGEVAVRTARAVDGPVAELTSVAPTVRDADPGLIDAALAALGWSADDLDPGYPIAIANAGASHLVLVVRTRQRLADLAYDFGTLAALMRRHDLITLQLIWPETKLLYHARDPFPPGGVIEDPATGAAAAAFGGYLRHLGLIEDSATFSIRQGEDMGRASELTVELVAGQAGVRVRGYAGPIAEAAPDSLTSAPQ